MLFSDIEYSLIRPENNTELSLFNINRKTGEISLRSFLDRERKNVHTLNVLASDQGNPPLSSVTKIVIDVLDANDNAPNFEELEYDVRLSDRASRGQFVAAVRATDLDEKTKLTYGIIDGNQDQVFDIDVDEGIVTLANLRNFDLTSSYNLNLSVSDGIYSAFAKLTVGLISANSYTPVFTKKSYKVQFAEGQPEGVRVAGDVKAIDEDRSDSITYSIQSDNLLQLFSIDSLSGEVWSRHMFDR